MKPDDLQKTIEARAGRISEELKAQFDNQLDVLAETIERLSDDAWTAAGKRRRAARVPVRQACHILGPYAAYATGDYEHCSKHFGVAVASFDAQLSAGQLPSRADVVAYVGVVRGLVHAWLDGLDNDTLLGPTSHPYWAARGATLLGRVLYIVRHGTYHFGKLCAELSVADQRFCSRAFR
jgi:hypothetical protein